MNILSKDISFIRRRTFYVVSIVIVFIALVALMMSCSNINKFYGLEDDNFIEEAVENVLESKIGIDLDLTPFTEEE